MAMASQHVTTQVLIQAATASNVAIVSVAKKLDSTYTCAWNKFKKCVDQNHASRILAEGEKYFTRENVDYYCPTLWPMP